MESTTPTQGGLKKGQEEPERALLETQRPRLGADRMDPGDGF